MKTNPQYAELLPTFLKTWNFMIQYIYNCKAFYIKGDITMGWMARNIDFSGHQIEIILLLCIFCAMAIWVFYDSDKYLSGVKRHILWLLTIITGPITLIIYLIMRKKLDY